MIETGLCGARRMPSSRCMSPVHLFDFIGFIMALIASALLGGAGLFWLGSLPSTAAARPHRQTALKLVSFAALFLTFGLFAGAYAWAGQ